METVCLVCNNVRNSTKQGISFQKLLTQIRKEFRKHNIDLKLRTVRDKTLADEVFYTNGYYDPEDDRCNECPIELIITHNFNYDTLWFPTPTTQLLVQIFDTTVHELRHMRQYRKRKFKPSILRSNSHVEYLSDPDEIDAYSISIATELCRTMGKHRAIRYMHNFSLLSRFKQGDAFVSPSLSMYWGSFSQTDHPVMLSLSKKIYVRLQKIDIDCVFL
jgi:hypothetical protein